MRAAERKGRHGAGSDPAPFPWLSGGLGALALVLALVPGAGAALVFDREAIEAGQIWRWVSGHWIHWSVEHLAWDAATFVALGAACEARSRTRLAACLAGSTLAISALVWWGLPSLAQYAGLSGIDCALFALLGAELFVEQRCRGSRWAPALAAGLALGLALKVGFEWTTGGTLFATHLGPGIVPVPEAHVAGAAIGVSVPLALKSRNDRRHGKGFPSE